MSSDLDAHLAAYAGGSQYDFDNEILLTWYPRRIIALASLATSMLELGLGHGFTAPIFAPYFRRHVVVEGSSAVIQNFRRKYPDVRTEIVRDLFERFETSERFDAIVMGFVLEHVEDPVALIKRYKRYLAPGGKLFIAVPNAQSLNRRLGFVAGLLDDLHQLSANDLALGHRRYYTLASLTAEAAKAGCRVERAEGIYLKPFTTQQIMALSLDKRVIEAMCQVGVDYPELSCGLLVQLTIV